MNRITPLFGLAALLLIAGFMVGGVVARRTTAPPTTIYVEPAKAPPIPTPVDYSGRLEKIADSIAGLQERVASLTEQLRSRQERGPDAGVKPTPQGDPSMVPAPFVAVPVPLPRRQEPVVRVVAEPSSRGEAELATPVTSGSPVQRKCRLLGRLLKAFLPNRIDCVFR